MATATRAVEWRFPPGLLVAFVLAALRFIQRLRPGGPAARFFSRIDYMLSRLTY